MCPGRIGITVRGRCKAYLIRGVLSLESLGVREKSDGLIWFLGSIGVVAKFRMRLLG